MYHWAADRWSVWALNLEVKLPLSFEIKKKKLQCVSRWHLGKRLQGRFLTCKGTYRRYEDIHRERMRPEDMNCPFNQSSRQVKTELLLHFFVNFLLPRNDHNPTVKFLATGFQWMQQCGKPNSQSAGISAESDFTLIVQTFASILGDLPVFRGQNPCPLHMEREK